MSAKRSVSATAGNVEQFCSRFISLQRARELRFLERGNFDKPRRPERVPQKLAALRRPLQLGQHAVLRLRGQ